MADRYWVGGSGSWANTSSWSASSGGASGASIPTSVDDVIFDDNSFGGALGTITVTATGNNFVTPFTLGRNIDFSAITSHSINWVLAGVSNPRMNIYGNLTLSTWVGTVVGDSSGPIINFAGNGAHTINTAGVLLQAVYIYLTDGGTLDLASNIGWTPSGPYGFSIQGGTFNTNNYTISCAGFGVIGNYFNATVNFGTSIVNIDLGTSSLNPFGGSDYSFSISSNGSFPAGIDATAATFVIQAGRNQTIFAPGGFTYHNVTIKGDGTNQTYINRFLSVSNDIDAIGIFDNLTITQSPVTIKLFRTSEATPWVATNFTAHGSRGKRITLRGEQRGLPNGGTIFQAGGGWTVGDTVYISGSDVWTINEVDPDTGAVISITLTDPGVDIINPGVKNMFGGSGFNLRLLVTVDVLQQYLYSDNPSVRYIDVQDNHALGNIPFADYPGGLDSGNNTNWDFGVNLFIQNVFMVGADEDGKVQTINIGKSDDGAPIYYELETQELEFGNRAHLKKIADHFAVFTRFGAQSTLQAKTDLFGYKDIPIVMSDRVNLGDKINLEGHYVTFKWFGSTSTVSPVLEGLYLPEVTDLGITHG